MKVEKKNPWYSVFLIWDLKGQKDGKASWKKKVKGGNRIRPV